MITGIRLFILNIGIAIATFLIVLDYSIANVSIPYISGDLGVSNDEGIYVITSFAVGSAIALPLSGWLRAQFGLVRILLISLASFVAFSVICAIAPNYGMLVVARFFQGIAGGPLIPLSQTLIIAINPEEKRNEALSFWALVVVGAPVVGPILGGWITFDYSWPWIFYINLPFGLLSIGIIWFFMRKKAPPQLEKFPMDWWGLLLLSIAVVTLQIAIDKGQEWDWFNSMRVRLLLTTSFLSFLFLAIWEYFKDKPLLDLKLLKVRTFSISICILLFIYGIYFGALVIVPLWLQTNMGYTSPWAGLAVAPMGIAPLLFTYHVGKFITKHGKIPALFISLICFIGACLYTAYFDTDVDFFHIGFSRLLFGFGMAFFITPLIALSVQDVPKDELANATGFFHFVRAMVGGVGASLFTTLWIRRTIYHHTILGANVTPFSDPSAFDLNSETGLATLNTVVDNQSAMLAINDCFFLMTAIFICLLPLLLLGRQKKGPQSASPIPIISD